jgi:hypothetical protein
VPARDEDPDGFEHETQRLVRDHIVQTRQLDSVRRDYEITGRKQRRAYPNSAVSGMRWA